MPGGPGPSRSPTESMVPESLASLTAFALFVAPGITYELLLRRRAHRVRSDTTFLEICRVVLASVSFTSAAGFIAFPVALVLGERDAVLASVGAEASEAEEALGRWWLWVLAIGVLSCGLAWAWHGVQVARGNVSVSAGATFATVMKEGMGEGRAARVLVETADGCQWQGEVSDYGLDDEGKLSDLVIGGAITRGKPGAAEFVELTDWTRIYFPITEIRTVRMAFVEQSTSAPGEPRESNVDPKGEPEHST